MATASISLSPKFKGSNTDTALIICPRMIDGPTEFCWLQMLLSQLLMRPDMMMLIAAAAQDLQRSGTTTSQIFDLAVILSNQTDRAHMRTVSATERQYGRGVRSTKED